MRGPWVYEENVSGTFSVGFYRPDGDWEGDSDHRSRADAAARVAYLNGGVWPAPDPIADEQPRGGLIELPSGAWVDQADVSQVVPLPSMKEVMLVVRGGPTRTEAVPEGDTTLAMTARIANQINAARRGGSE